MPNNSVVDFEYDPIITGPCASVAYARRANGKKPAQDYIEGLQRADQAKLAKLFTTMARVGNILNKERFRKLRGRIFEFKVHPGVRVLCYQHGKTWFLTHGYDKQTGKTPPKEIDRAEAIMDEHLSFTG